MDGRNKSDLICRDACLRCKDIFQEKLTDCFLYGSYARGDYGPESDVDIAVIVNEKYENINKNRHLISCINSDLSLQYDVTVSITVQPKFLFDQFADVLPFYANIRKEGIRCAV